MKKWIVLLAVVAAALALTACGSPAASGGAPAQGGAVPGSPMSPTPRTSSPSMVGTTPTSPATALTGPALAGQSIYVDGQTASGPVRFTAGVNAGNGACANCHGATGGGGSGPAIGWNHLTRRMSMKNMPKFIYTTSEQVIKAITSGVRPDGTKLSLKMPRFELTAADASALIAYLQARK